MASIFLSYVREDVEKARALAALLERAGQSVWWDRRIKGGAQYSSEIEVALAAADKIIVLWSARSVTSAWVRDEAGVARDSGRLVPVKIDGTEPPLGFRQFQAIDLSRWKGRSHAAELEELLEALGPPTPNGTLASSTAEPARARIRFAFPPWLIAASLAILLAVIGSGWWWVSRSSAHTPIVAIDTASGSEKSRQVARGLAVQLGNLQSARGDSFQLISGSGNADIILQVDASDGAGALHRDLSVLSGANRSILWSASLQQPPDKADDLSQQLMVTSERVLSCALEALSHRKEVIDPPTLKLYLSGCSRLENVYGQGRYDPALVKLFEQVIAKAPHFEGAWAKLLTTESEAARSPDPPPVLVNKLKDHIAQSEKLGLHFGELYAAKAALLPQSDFLGILSLLERGIKADPDNAFLYRLHSEEAERVGRMGDAIYDAGQAIQFDPLSPALEDSQCGSHVPTGDARHMARSALDGGGSPCRFPLLLAKERQMARLLL